MYGEKALKKVLNQKFKEMKQKNDSFSLRAFAKKLGVGHATLSNYLIGKRSISAKLAVKIIHALELDLKDQDVLLALFQKDEAGNQYVEIDKLKIKAVTEWYYSAISSLSETMDFHSDPGWIAERLGISRKTAETAIEDLITLKILMRKDDGSIVPQSDDYILRSNEITENILRKLWQQHLDKSKEKLASEELSKMSIVSGVLPMSPESIPEAKKMIVKFLDNLTKFLGVGDKSEVYLASIQLVPLTKRKK